MTSSIFRSLENLSFEDTVEVIRLNLECEERTDNLETLEDMRPRLQALYRMTGGNPRLTMMLYELIAHESVTSVQDQFHLLLDRISPFYQGRLNDLPPGQRALRECLASMRDQEKTPAAIAARMRMSQQETSSLLKRLSDAHYLRASRHPRDRRSRLYTIREGFFRHLARDESFPQRTQAHAVPARVLQPLLSEHRGPRGKATPVAREASRKGQCRRGAGPRLPK